MRPVPTRGSVVALGLATLVVASAATSAPAATPRFTSVAQPLQAGTAARSATGDGHVAWSVPDSPSPVGGGGSDAIWTVKDGVATRVAGVAEGAGPRTLEVGTDRRGVPVAVTRTTDGTQPVIRLVNLDTGATQSFPSKVRGLPVGGIALDRGSLYFTLHVQRVGKRNTSALWRAPLTALRAGTAKKVRTSRRGETWGEVLADRGRVAIRTQRDATEGGRRGYLEQIAFGTPHGTWNRTGDVLVQEGPVNFFGIAGFTQDRSAVVTTQNPDDGALRATVTPIRHGGRTQTALLGTTGPDSLTATSYEPATGRFLASGPDASGAPSVGYTARVFGYGAATAR